MKQRRELWHEQLKDVDFKRLVFIDESGAKTDMTRTRGRAAAGQRVVEKLPHGHWKTTTMISAIRSSGPCAAATIDAPECDIDLAE